MVNQMKDILEVRKPNLIPHAAKKLVNGFTQFFDIQQMFRMPKHCLLLALQASLNCYATSF